MAAGVAGSFEERQRAVREPAQKRAGVVNLHRRDLAGQVVFPLFDECLGHRRDLGDRAIQPQRHVDVVGQQVAGHAAARDGVVQPPQAFAALRQVLGDGPVL